MIKRSPTPRYTPEAQRRTREKSVVMIAVPWSPLMSIIQGKCRHIVLVRYLQLCFISALIQEMWFTFDILSSKLGRLPSRTPQNPERGDDAGNILFDRQLKVGNHNDGVRHSSTGPTGCNFFWTKDHARMKPFSNTKKGFRLAAWGRSKRRSLAERPHRLF